MSPYRVTFIMLSVWLVLWQAALLYVMSPCDDFDQSHSSNRTHTVTDTWLWCVHVCVRVYVYMPWVDCVWIERFCRFSTQKRPTFTTVRTCLESSTVSTLSGRSYWRCTWLFFSYKRLSLWSDCEQVPAVWVYAKLETKASPRRQCSTGRILSCAYDAIREWS